MAYGTDHTYVLERILEEEIRNFAVYNTDNKTLIAEDKSGTLTPQQVRDRVEKTLAYCTGLVYVELARKSGEEVSAGGKIIKNMRIPVQCGTSTLTAQPTQGIGNAGGQQDLITQLQENFNTKLDAMRAEMRKDNEIADLKKQLAEAKEGNPTMKMLEPHIPMVIEGIFGTRMPMAPAKIAGPGPEPAAHPETVSLDENAEKLAEDLIRRLLAVDQDFLQVLERLAVMAETNKPMYDMAKNMLPK